MTQILTQAVHDPTEEEEESEDRIFYRSVYSIPLTVRTQFFLKINGIRELGQLVTKSEKELEEKKEFTPELLADIKERLEEANLDLEMKDIPYVERNIL